MCSLNFKLKLVTRIFQCFFVVDFGVICARVRVCVCGVSVCVCVWVRERELKILNHTVIILTSRRFWTSSLAAKSVSWAQYHVESSFPILQHHQNVFDVMDRTPGSYKFCVQVMEKKHVDCNHFCDQLFLSLVLCTGHGRKACGLQ